MNIMQMMQNVQKMQKKLTNEQKELENVEVKADEEVVTENPVPMISEDVVDPNYKPEE